MGFDFSGMKACSSVLGSKTCDIDLGIMIPKQASMMPPRISLLKPKKTLKQPIKTHNNLTRQNTQTHLTYTYQVSTSQGRPCNRISLKYSWTRFAGTKLLSYMQKPDKTFTSNWSNSGNDRNG